MPAVSERQRRAMYAAAAGHSSLGIPRKVGEEFVGKAKDAYADRRWDAPPAKDMSRLDWCGLSHGLVKFFREEMTEPAHAAVDAEFEEGKHPRDHGKFSAVAYHGSKHHDLSVVKSNVDDRQFDNATSQFGAFFAPDKEGAQKYAGEGGKIYEKELGLENAYVMPWKEFNYFQSPNRSKEDADGFTKSIDADGWTARGDELKQEAITRRKELEAKGHDGIVIRRPNGEVFEIASFKDVSLARDTQPTLATTPNSAAPPARRRADDADETPPRAASVLIIDPAGRVLLVRRAATEENWPDTWAFPGGKVDTGETPEEAARRETEEEVGYAPDGPLTELETKRTPYGWDHTTYLHRAAEVFEPKLNAEHSESGWFNYGKWPAPLHPGVAATLEGLPENAADLLTNDDEIGEDAEFEEGKHPRDHGKFSISSGSETNNAESWQNVKAPVSKEDAVAKLESLPTVPDDERWFNYYGPDGKVEKPSSFGPEVKTATLGLRKGRAIVGMKEDERSVDGFIPLDLIENTQPSVSVDLVKKYIESPPDKSIDVVAWTDRDGVLRFISASGTHRMAAAKMRGVENMPVRFQMWPSPNAKNVASKTAALKFLKSRGFASNKATDEIGEDVDLKRNPDGSLQPTLDLGEILPRTTRELRWTGTPLGGHPGPRYNGGEAADMALAEDKKTLDHDGRMHVDQAPLTRAGVFPYLGSEINGVMKDEPGWIMLDPSRRYNLLRPADEIQKAADTFRGLPILWRHKPASAMDHPADITIGATGSDVVFEYPFLKSSLVIWPAYASEAIENKSQHHLSAGYAYKAVMEPSSAGAESWDGRMVDLIGNHVALVATGRSGPTVAIDSRVNIQWAVLDQALRALSHEVNP